VFTKRKNITTFQPFNVPTKSKTLQRSNLSTIRQKQKHLRLPFFILYLQKITA